MPDAPHRCGCHTPPARWGGALTCHCSGCGLTFSGVSTFDEHQVNGRCLTIAQVNRRAVGKRAPLQVVRPGVLGRPSPSHDPSTGHQEEQ